MSTRMDYQALLGDVAANLETIETQLALNPGEHADTIEQLARTRERIAALAAHLETNPDVLPDSDEINALRTMWQELQARSKMLGVPGYTVRVADPLHQAIRTLRGSIRSRLITGLPGDDDTPY